MVVARKIVLCKSNYPAVAVVENGLMFPVDVKTRIPFVKKDLLTGMESVSLTIREGKGYLEDFPF